MMTVQEFKQRYPNLAHMEGNDLWDAIEKAVILENGAPILSNQQAEDYFREHFCVEGPLQFQDFGFFIPQGITITKNKKDDTKRI